VISIDIQKIVERLGEEFFEAHRGAFWWEEGRCVAIVFGNDGYATDGRAKLEVEAARRLLGFLDGRELAFATDSVGYSWALACQVGEPGAVNLLQATLWLAWNRLSAQKGKGEPLSIDSADLQPGAIVASAPYELGGCQPNIAGAILERGGLI
jgi:hypothetical protein